MLGVLCCARPKPWILSALSFTHAAPHHRSLTTTNNSLSFLNISSDDRLRRRRHHSSACQHVAGAASIWHGILPSSARNDNRRLTFHHEQKGEGSWNVASDARPARWLHGSDSAWLLFGVCACVAPFDFCYGNPETLVAASPPPPVVDAAATASEISSNPNDDTSSSSSSSSSLDYRVTGVPADGRCLFRAVAYGACLINGEGVPDEIHQRELADDLRAQVVDELLKRRKETEWFIEGDFDAYVKNIREPNTWGGEPELLMASHVLRKPISVFMIERNSRKLTNVANYGEDYAKDDKNLIKVVFHGYGHYDVLEIFGSKTPGN